MDCRSSRSVPCSRCGDPSRDRLPSRTRDRSEAYQLQSDEYALETGPWCPPRPHYDAQRFLRDPPLRAPRARDDLRAPPAAFRAPPRAVLRAPRAVLRDPPRALLRERPAALRARLRARPRDADLRAPPRDVLRARPPPPPPRAPPPPDSASIPASSS